MTPRDRILGALKGEKFDRTPATAVKQVGTVEAMEKVGAYWPAAHSDPEQMVKLGVSLYKLAGLETARIPFCLTVQAEALRCGVNMGAMGKQPSVTEHLETIPEEVPGDFLSRGEDPDSNKGHGAFEEAVSRSAKDGWNRGGFYSHGSFSWSGEAHVNDDRAAGYG